MAEVLPFVAMDDQHCEEVLAEYTVSLEHEDATDIVWLRKAIARGMDALLNADDPCYDAAIVRLFEAASKDLTMIPWCMLIVETHSEQIFDAANLAMTRLGLQKPWTD